jgi:hypothetical protein
VNQQKKFEKYGVTSVTVRGASAIGLPTSSLT